MLSFFPRDVLDGFWDLFGSISERFLTYLCIEITGTNWYWFILQNVENRKEKSLRVKKL